MKWKEWLWRQNKEALFILVFSSIIGFIISTKLSFTMAARHKQAFFIFPIKYLLFLAIGTVLYTIFSSLDWKRLEEYLPKCFYLFVFLCILTLILGRKINGVRRWIFIGSFSLQASEFLKFLILYMNAKYLAQDQHWKCVINLGISCILFLLQPDLGMTVLMIFSSCVQIVTVNKNLKLYVKLLMIVIVLLLLSGIFLATYSHNRFSIFLGKEKGYQIVQGLKLLKQSSIFGIPATIYIPDSHCDFVFTEVCGFFGIIVGIFITFLPILLYKSILPHLNKKTLCDDRKQIFLLGLSSQYLIQCYIHICSNLSIIPTKGMNLPIISFGGSNVICYFWFFGLISSLTVRNKD